MQNEIRDKIDRNEAGHAAAAGLDWDEACSGHSTHASYRIYAADEYAALLAREQAGPNVDGLKPRAAALGAHPDESKPPIDPRRAIERRSRTRWQASRKASTPRVLARGGVR